MNPAAGQCSGGYWTSWGGTFEQLQSAAARLQIVIPLSLLLVFTLLFMMFGNIKDGLLVFTSILFAWQSAGCAGAALPGPLLSLTILLFDNVC